MNPRCTPGDRHLSFASHRPCAAALLSVASAILLISCAEPATAPSNDPHNSSSGRASASAASKSAQHGVIHVDASAAPGGDGSGRAPFKSLGDAVLLANAQGGGKIEVEAGVYLVSRTISVESPLSIQGSNDMQSDPAGLPTGILAPGTETRIVGATAMGALPVIAVGRSDGVMHGVTIANLTVRATGALGIGIEIRHTQDFTIRNTIVTSPGFGISTIASSGRIVGNYLTKNVCGACIAAGNAQSPAVVEIKGNRVVRNTSAGILLNGSGTTLTEEAGDLVATVRDNDIDDNSSNSMLGYGIRVFVIRRDGPDSQTAGNVRATVDNNRVANNRIGIVIDAGFPYRTFRGIPDSRLYTGRIDLTLRGNTLTGNVMPALVSFTRSTAAIDQRQLNPVPAPGSSHKYLQDATYQIVDRDGALAGYRLDHPGYDPVDHRLLRNEFWYNGSLVPIGRTLP